MHAEMGQAVMTVMNLDNLNGIGKGVDKCWIYKNPLSVDLAHDYLQKINFSIQDINYLLSVCEQSKRRTDIISMIVMVDWVVDSVWQYKSCLLPNLLDDFLFSEQETLCKSYSFIKGIRSFIIAHPLATERHHQFGFDGDLICIDLRSSKPILFDYGNNEVKRLGFDGIEEWDEEQDDDFYLFVYSKRAKAKYFKYLVIDLAEIIKVARIDIMYLYEMDSYLGKLRKKDYAAK